MRAYFQILELRFPITGKTDIPSILHRTVTFFAHTILRVINEAEYFHYKTNSSTKITLMMRGWVYLLETYCFIPMNAKTIFLFLSLIKPEIIAAI